MTDSREPVPAEQTGKQQTGKQQTWKLTLAYDGTDFSGWQVQPGKATIRASCRPRWAALRANLLSPRFGRTDAGVHALGQIASFVLQAPIPRRTCFALSTAPFRSRSAFWRRKRFRSRFMPDTRRSRRPTSTGSSESQSAPFLARYALAYSWPWTWKPSKGQRISLRENTTS